MNTVKRIIDILTPGGLEHLGEHPIKLENGAYMALCIEAIGTGPRGLPQVSVAHYSEQNGDAMRDPDMVFEIDAAGAWHPVTFRNDYVGTYQEAVYQDEAGRVLIRPRLVADLKSFARTWDKNIKEQGFIDAAKTAAAARAARN